MSNQNPDAGTILVTGATGKQGGAVVRALLKAGRPVRALSRDPNSAAAQALSAQGVEVVKGDFNDATSLDAALKGVDGVFSVQMGSHPGDPDTEIVTGRALIEAARRAGVRVIVHTSVARAGDQKNFIGWDEGRWEPLYWDNKAAVIDMVKAQGFPHWVILKPALIMEDIIPPMADMQFPSLRERGRFETAIDADVGLDWIAAKDIGEFAAAAFADPARFHGHEIDLAAETFTCPRLPPRWLRPQASRLQPSPCRKTRRSRDPWGHCSSKPRHGTMSRAIRSTLMPSVVGVCR